MKMLNLFISCFFILSSLVIGPASSSSIGNNINFGIIGIPIEPGPTNIENENEFDIVKNPLFPNIIDLPIGDLVLKKPGFAYAGSNPSFEIQLKNKSNSVEIRTVNLTDSNGVNYEGIPFFSHIVSTTTDKIILSITIPDEASLGSCKLTLNLFDNSSITNNSLEIISFYQSSVKNNNKVLGKPTIKKIKIHKSDSGFLISIHGKNFAPKNIIYTVDSTKKESNDIENTKISIFPSTITSEILSINVPNPNKLNTRLELTDSLKEASEIILIISTPRGITSKLIKL